MLFLVTFTTFLYYCLVYNLKNLFLNEEVKLKLLWHKRMALGYLNLNVEKKH